MELGLPAAVYTKEPAPHLSARYVHVSTEEVVKLMKDEGFFLADWKTQRGDGAYSPHLLDFRHLDAPMILGGEAAPRVLFGNSHNGKTTAFCTAGVFRLVCSNGLVIGNTIYSARVRHAGDQARDLVNRMRQMAKETSPLIKQIEAWRNKEMSQSEIREFVKRAAILRFGDAERFSMEGMLRIRRETDEANDLWTVFNRIQENTVMGGVAGVTASGRAIQSRPITQIGRSLQYNQQLWRLAEQFAE